ncbi:conserved hypothetical protein [Lebetimonas natsushimae]|uniref:Periplasmic protein n=1 Tax=Lebetimonas natsushimae TaxID=1936991 RepID=A0A292YDN2_9BACT|nr:hypothetical protein [Lebetimonas natsushimae]GAX87768.1 conserved hypothetical protein [Lebetimonas natsushimae]
MKKLIIFLGIFLFANNYVINLIGKQEYENYAPLLKFDNNLTLKESVKKLENLGLINLFFDKPQIINTEFVFENNNPILEAKILYKTLNLMGYYYFYPSKLIYQNNKYTVDIEMKTNHYINPLILINTIENYGCRVVNIIKKDKYYYFIDAQNAKLPAIKLNKEEKKYINAKGEYWVTPNGFKKMSIVSSKLDNWYPYIVFYDKNLNILNIIAYKKVCRFLSLNIPEYTVYIKIKDNFSKINFKRGILIKGLK